MLYSEAMPTPGRPWFKILVLLGCVLAPIATLAQPTADPVPIWTLQEENAALAASIPRDHFYTNGLSVGWMSPEARLPATLAHLAQTVWGEGQQRFGFDLTQQIYTPANTRVSVPNPRDEPYGGVLMGTVSLLNDTANHRDIMAIGAGVLGPWAGGGELQNGYHDLIHRPPALGWAYEIQNTPVLNLRYDRVWRWPLLTVGDLETDVLPAAGGDMGNLHDDAWAGINLRIGQGLGSDFGAPRVPPGMGGGGAFTPIRSFVWYIFAGADVQAVAYDMLLQAAPFRSGPAVSPIWHVAEVEGGVAVMIGDLRVTGTYVGQTPAFDRQCGGLHQFALVSLSMRF